MSIWGRKRKLQDEAREALAAKIQAGVDHAAAEQARREIGEQSRRLREINQTNHFSEGLTKAFRSKPV